MLDIIILIFLGKHISKLAIQKGLSSTNWVILLLIAWFSGFFIGTIIGASFFEIDITNINTLIPIALIAYPIAFAGFHFIKTILEKKPDARIDNNIF